MGLAVFARRSIFELRSVLQLVKVLESTGWTITEEVKAFTKLRQRKLYSSQVAEDGFNTCKRVETKSLNHRAPPSTLYAHLAGEGVLRKRHHFNELVADMSHNYDRSSALPEETFVPGFDEAKDPPFRKIVGGGSTTPWYSCKSTEWNAPYADLALLRAAVLGDISWDDVPKAWMSCLLDAPRLLVRRKLQPLDARHADRWYFSLGSALGESAILWPADRNAFKGDATSTYFVPGECDKLILASVVDLSQWEAWSFEWLSPLSQWEKFESCRRTADFNAVRAFPTTIEHDSLKNVAAKEAFWNMSVKTLKMLAAELKVPDREHAQKTFDLLFLLVQFVLKTTHDETLKIVSKRMATMQGLARSSVAEILALDEGLELCAKHEVEEIRHEQRKVKSLNNESDDFVADFRLARQKSSEGPGKKMKMTYKPLPAGEMTQQDAKEFLPEGARIWRNNAVGGWCGHYKPYARCSALTALHGSEGALRIVLRTLWLQHLSISGLAHSACPWEGLLPTPSGAAASSSGSSGAPIAKAEPKAKAKAKPKPKAKPGK